VRNRFYILDHPLLPTPYNHRFFVEKFARGFGYRGYDVSVIRSVAEATGPGFVMISNHDYTYRLLPPRGRVAAKLATVIRSDARLPTAIRRGSQHRVLRQLANVATTKGLVVLAWFWHDHSDEFDEFGIPVIFTGEHFYDEPTSVEHRELWEFYQRERRALSIPFSADVDPDRVGVDCTNDRFDVCYVGSGAYKPEWYRFYAADPANRIVPTPPYIDEDERLRVYRESKLSLGLHSELNIANHVVVERVFESLALGAVCVSDNLAAVRITDGLVSAVGDADSLHEATASLLADDERRHKLRASGFDFIRHSGTYAHRADAFIALGTELYG